MRKVLISTAPVELDVGKFIQAEFVKVAAEVAMADPPKVPWWRRVLRWLAGPGVKSSP